MSAPTEFLPFVCTIRRLEHSFQLQESMGQKDQPSRIFGRPQYLILPTWLRLLYGVTDGHTHPIDGMLQQKDPAACIMMRETFTTTLQCRAVWRSHGVI